MIGLVLVTHGRLAVEFRSALEHVVGPQGQIEAVTIGPDDDVEERRKDIIEAVKRVDTGDGVAILTDMFGGTPSNLAISVMSRPKVEVLAGINLPMLVKLAKVRDECPLAEAVAAAQDAGRKYVTIASRVLTGQMSAPTPGSEERAPDATGFREGAIVRKLDICNRKGLHARASAKFVQTVEKFDADVRVMRSGETVGGTSIMGLMMLAAAPGTSITVEATGKEAAQVVEALAVLDRFAFRRRRLSSRRAHDCGKLQREKNRGSGHAMSSAATKHPTAARWRQRQAAHAGFRPRRSRRQRPHPDRRRPLAARQRLARTSGRRYARNSITGLVFDGQTLRIEFGVTRLDEVKPDVPSPAVAIRRAARAVAGSGDRAHQPDAADRSGLYPGWGGQDGDGSAARSRHRFLTSALRRYRSPP